MVTQVLLGPTAVATNAVREMKNAIARNAHRLTWHHQQYLPALFVRCLQLCLSFWAANQLLLATALTFPDTKVVEQTAMGDTSWVAPLPAAYMQHHAPAPPPGGTPGARPGPAMAPAPAMQADEQRMISREGGPSSKFADILARSVAVRTIKKRIRDSVLTAPTDGQGRQRCLAWAVKGIRNTRCGQAHDHLTDHTEQEETNFYEWCVQHYNA